MEAKIGVKILTLRIDDVELKVEIDAGAEKEVEITPSNNSA